MVSVAGSSDMTSLRDGSRGVSRQCRVASPRWLERKVRSRIPKHEKHCDGRREGKSASRVDDPIGRHERHDYAVSRIAAIIRSLFQRAFGIGNRSTLRGATDAGEYVLTDVDRWIWRGAGSSAKAGERKACHDRARAGLLRCGSAVT